MIAIQQIIGITFRIINFGVLIGLAIYGFKKYALPMIKQQIADKQAFITSLINQEQELEHEQKTVIKKIKGDKEQCAHLKDKIDQWRRKVSQVYAERDKERDQYIAFLKERSEHRMEQVASVKLFARVMPQALEQARMQLLKQYADEHEAHQYIKQIIEHMDAGKR